MDKVSICYFNKTYSIELTAFNARSNFFLQKGYNDSNLNLTNEFSLIYSEEIINTFIQYFYNQNINIDKSNAIQLNYLSIKFKVHDLIKITEDYIDNHYQELVNEFLNRKNIKSSIIYEKILSNHLNEFINDDRLMILPISTIYRILDLHFKSEFTKIDECTKIDFLIKCIKAKGKISSILFNIAKFGDKDIIYLNEKIKELKSNIQKTDLLESLLQNPDYIFQYIEY